MVSSQKRRLARAAKHAQQHTTAAFMSSASSSAYTIIGGIAFNLFEIPAARDPALFSTPADSLIEGTASEPCLNSASPRKHPENTKILAPAVSTISRVPADGVGSHQDAGVLVIVPFGPAPPEVFLSTSSGTEDKLFRRIALGEPTNLCSANILSWTRGEVIRLHQTQTGSKQSDFTETVTEETGSARDQALVLYHSPYPPSQNSPNHLADDSFYGSSSSPSQTDPDEDSSWGSHTGRVFLSSIDGELFVINPTELLYKVQIIDETASDFDSIASPIKPGLNVTTEADMSDKSRFHQEDDFLPDLSDHSEGGFSDFYCGESIEKLEHYDPFSNFSSFGAIHDILSDGTRQLSQHEECDEELKDLPPREQHTESGTGGEMYHAKNEQDIDVQKDLGYDPLTEDTLADPPTDPYPHTAEESTSTAASNWARELAHTMLGTESLFTFLNELQAENDGTATKMAVTTAFLQLVDYERHKLGEALLPRSCTAARILDSRILPHTTVLGTITLAVFISALAFDLNEAVSVVGIYRTFKDLSRAELRTHEMATRGTMGMLGRTLGKIF